MLSAGPSKPFARGRDECRSPTVVLDQIGPTSTVGSPGLLAIPSGSSPCLNSSQVF
jgi:hypothetical protein